MPGPAGATPFVVERLGDAVSVIAVTATTHAGDASVLAETLDGLLAEGRSRIVVDLSGARLVNSKLLDVLVRAAADLDPRRGEGIVVVTGADYVRHMLEISATGGLLLVAESRAEALATLGA